MLKILNFRFNTNWYLSKIVMVMFLVAGIYLFWGLPNDVDKKVIHEQYLLGTIQAIRTIEYKDSTSWEVQVVLPEQDTIKTLFIVKRPSPVIGMKVPIHYYRLKNGEEIFNVDQMAWQLDSNR